MYLIHMRPEQLQAAVSGGVPLVMAAGVVEYHGPHLPIGTDLLIASRVAEEAERLCDCVLAPPLPYGPTMSWAGGPEEGEMDFDPSVLKAYAKETLRHFMRMGFQRIYIIQHHQGPEGAQALSLKLAAAELVREETHGWGEKWGRREYSSLPHPNVFGWIQVCSIDDFPHAPREECGLVPMDHAGRGETQFILGGYPESVRMEALNEMREKPDWLADAPLADADEGRRWIEHCARGWAAELGKHTAWPVQ